MRHPTTTPSGVTTLADTARAVVCDIADQFQHSWNTADGPAYAEPFAEDADCVTSEGRLLAGRDEISAGVADILATIHLGSTIELRVDEVRCISPTTIVARIEQTLDAPAGPLAGMNTTVATVVVVETTQGWEVVNLHDTLRRDPLIDPPTGR